MADEIFEWTGNAPPVAQIDDVTIDAVAAQIYTLTINGKVVVYEHAGGGTAADVINGLVDAWNANPYPECLDVVASNEADTACRLQSALAGTPYTVVAGTNLTLTNKSAASGPNFWGQAENYRNLSTGAPSGTPAINDEVHIRQNRPGILYGLLSMSTITLKSFIIDQPMLGEIGLAQEHPNGYSEYRDTFLTQPVTALVIGRGDGAGSPRIQIGLEAANASVTIHQTGASTEANRRAVQLENADGANASIDIRNGQVDLNKRSASKGGFKEVNVTGGQCRIWPDFNKTPAITADINISDSGSVVIGAAANINGKGGNVTLADNATVNTAIIDGACNVVAQLAGGIQNLTIDHPSAQIDLSRHPHNVAINAWTLKRGTIRDPNGVIQWTAGTLPRGIIQVAEQ